LPAVPFVAKTYLTATTLNNTFDQTLYIPFQNVSDDTNFRQVSPGILQAATPGKYLINLTIGAASTSTGANRVLDLFGEIVQNTEVLRNELVNVVTSINSTSYVNVVINTIVDVIPLDILAFPITVARNSLAILLDSADLHLIMTPI